MKHSGKTLARICLAGFAGLALGQMAAADGFKRITIEAEYRALMAGKKSSFGSDWYQTRADGTIVGMRGGEKYRANCAWRDGFLCRTELTHAKDTDCQMIEAGPASFRITRRRGKEPSFEIPRK